MKPQVKGKPNFWLYERIGVLEVNATLFVKKGEYKGVLKNINKNLHKGAKARGIIIKVYPADGGWIVKRI